MSARKSFELKHSIERSFSDFSKYYLNLCRQITLLSEFRNKHWKFILIFPEFYVNLTFCRILGLLYSWKPYPGETYFEKILKIQRIPADRLVSNSLKSVRWIFKIKISFSWDGSAKSQKGNTLKVYAWNLAIMSDLTKLAK